MNDRLSALRLFQRVARTGNFSRAARDVGISQPSASRIIADLEQEIGAVLFVRTTRTVTLTEAGADYLARVEPVLDALDEADHAARGTGELRGLLRIAQSSSFGVREIVPRLPGFLAQHPALRIDILISDARQDLVAEGVDVALRLGPLADSTARARKLAQSPRLLIASPDYLRRAGAPQTPADLAEHSVIVGPGSGTNAWAFERDGRHVSVTVEGRVLIAANEGAIAAAVAGLGITRSSHWGCRAELDDGRLVAVLAGCDAGEIDLHAVFPGAGIPRPAARAFVDYLAEQFRQV